MKKYGKMIVIAAAVALLASCSPQPVNHDIDIRKESNAPIVEEMERKEGIHPHVNIIEPAPSMNELTAVTDQVKVTAPAVVEKEEAPEVGASRHLRGSVWEDGKGELRAAFDGNGIPESPAGFVTVKKSESAASVIYVTERKLTLIDGSTESTVMTSEFEIMDEDTVLASFTLEVTGEPTIARKAVLSRVK